MVISLNSKPRKVRKWWRSQVYCMYYFRIAKEQEKVTTNPQEKNKLTRDLTHLWKEVEQHMKYGETLKIDEDQIREFNLAVIEEVKKGKSPQAIIQTLIKENGHN